MTLNKTLLAFALGLSLSRLPQERHMTDYEKFSNMIKELGIPAYFNNPNAELNEPKRVDIMNNTQGTKAQFNFSVEGKYESVTFV